MKPPLICITMIFLIFFLLALPCRHPFPLMPLSTKLSLSLSCPLSPISFPLSHPHPPSPYSVTFLPSLSPLPLSAFLSPPLPLSPSSLPFPPSSSLEKFMVDIVNQRKRRAQVPAIYNTDLRYEEKRKMVKHCSRSTPRSYLIPSK